MKGRNASDQETADKWEVQLRKGCLELAILAALWDGKLYGLEILRRLESDSDLIVSEGTVYPLLSRLKALGLVRSEWVESDAGHPRKYYALTPAGKQRSSRDGWDVDAVLDEHEQVARSTREGEIDDHNRRCEAEDRGLPGQVARQRLRGVNTEQDVREIVEELRSHIMDKVASERRSDGRRS